MPTSRFKILQVEQDGVESAFPKELQFDADKMYFNNASSLFSSDNVQGAIEEGTNLAIDLPRFPISAVHNGTMNDGQLVGVTNLVNNPLIVPTKSKLANITFYQGGGATKNGSYRFYINSETPSNLFFTWGLAATELAIASSPADFTSPIFLAGEQLNIYFNSTGSSHSSVSLMCFFQAVP